MSNLTTPYASTTTSLSLSSCTCLYHPPPSYSHPLFSLAVNSLNCPSYPFTHSSAPTIPLILSRSRHLYQTPHTPIQNALTSSTFPPLHSTHLSSSTILHLFLSSNNPAEPDLNRNLNLTATCPSHEPMYFSSPFSYLTFLYYFKLLFLSTSSCQSSQFCRFSIFLFQCLPCHCSISSQQFSSQPILYSLQPLSYRLPPWPLHLCCMFQARSCY